MNNDCCLILNQSLDLKRIFKRFHRYSLRTNFDFKIFDIEQLTIERRQKRDLLEISSKKLEINDHQNENLSSDDDDENEMLSSESERNSIDENYLDDLVKWEPNRLPQIEFDDEQEEISSNSSRPINNNELNSIDLPAGK